MSDRATIVKTLSALRIGVGVTSLVAPRFAGKVFGVSPARNPGAPYVTRLFGVRDAALAYGALSSSGTAQEHWIATTIACDFADIFAGIAAGRGGYLPKPAAAAGTAVALTATAMGVAALRAPAADGTPPPAAP